MTKNNKKLGFGLMRLPLTDPEDPKALDQGRVNQMVDQFLAGGFTYFDTAFAYHKGMSEVTARKALVERHPRSSFTLTDKMPLFMVKSAEDYPTLFAKQLERTGVEYFDTYLLHNLGGKNYPITEQLGGFDFLKKLKEEGRVRRIGFSFHDDAVLLDRVLTAHPEIEVVQLQINYADWESEMIQSRKCYEVAVRHKKPVIVMEPVKGGSLARVPEAAQALFSSAHPDWSAATWAIRFAASLPEVEVVLSGMSDEAQVADNVAAMGSFVPLDQGEQQLVSEATAIFNQSIAIACTACRYCTDDCPSNIPIPEYLALYNNQYQFRKLPAHSAYYDNFAQRQGKASSCIGCRQCERHCPQHIEIVQWLKEIATLFEQD